MLPKATNGNYVNSGKYDMLEIIAEKYITTKTGRLEEVMKTNAVTISEVIDRQVRGVGRLGKFQYIKGEQIWLKLKLCNAQIIAAKQKFMNHFAYQYQG